MGRGRRGVPLGDSVGRASCDRATRGVPGFPAAPPARPRRASPRNRSKGPSSRTDRAAPGAKIGRSRFSQLATDPVPSQGSTKMAPGPGAASDEGRGPARPRGRTDPSPHPPARSSGRPRAPGGYVRAGLPRVRAKGEVARRARGALTGPRLPSRAGPSGRPWTERTRKPGTRPNSPRGQFVRRSCTQPPVAPIAPCG